MAVWALAAGSGGKVASGDDSGVLRIRQNGQELDTVNLSIKGEPRARIRGVAWTNKGSLVVGIADGRVLCWNGPVTNLQASPTSWKAADGGIQNLVAVGDRVVCNTGNGIYVAPASATSFQAVKVTAAPGVSALAVTPSGSHVAIAFDKRVHLLPAASLAADTLKLPPRARCAG